ncbi:MAG: hypothetical protein ACYDH9_25040, partial [Limisphaerales bacterium]
MFTRKTQWLKGLAIAAKDTQNGTVYVFYGTSSGHVSSFDRTYGQGGANYLYFGYSVAFIKEIDQATSYCSVSSIGYACSTKKRPHQPRVSFNLQQVFFHTLS